MGQTCLVPLMALRMPRLQVPRRQPKSMLSFRRPPLRSLPKPVVPRGHRLGATMGRPSAVRVQRDGDKIFLNFAKRRKIARSGISTRGQGLNLTSGRGETGMEALAVGETFLFEAFRLDRRGLFRRD